MTISDLIIGVNIVLGTQPTSACPAFENAQGTVVAQLIKGVNNALEGCSLADPVAGYWSRGLGSRGVSRNRAPRA